MTSVALRMLAPSGVERFRAYLERLRAGAVEPPPFSLLADPSASVEPPVAVTLARRTFRDRFDAARFLYQALAPLPAEEIDTSRGLWAWLALAYFDELCPVRADGTRRPGRDYRHVPDFSFRHRYRHLLFGPYAVYRRHEEAARLLLCGPLHREPALYQDITSRSDLLAGRGVIEALNALYLDEARGLPKRGAQAGADRPGTVRRFVRVLQQLDVTHDILGMSGQELLELLPAEFDAWRTQPALIAAR